MTTDHKDFVAVSDFAFTFDETALKQLAVMFDRIAILPRNLTNDVLESLEFKKTRAWLVATGILFELSLDKALEAVAPRYGETGEQVRKDVDDVFLKPRGISVEEVVAARGNPEKMAEIKERVDQGPEPNPEVIDYRTTVEGMQRMISISARLLTLGVRKVENVDAYAVISGEQSSLYQEDEQAKDDVMRIALGLPAPDQTTQWNRILAYRNDPEARKQFRLLKNCLSDIARGSLNPEEVEETLGHLVNEYRQQMQRHEIYTDFKRMETYIVTTAETASKFEAFSWSAVAQSWFGIEHRKLRLLEGESTEPGSEVAYLIDGGSMFSEP